MRCGCHSFITWECWTETSSASFLCSPKCFRSFFYKSRSVWTRISEEILLSISELNNIVLIGMLTAKKYTGRPKLTLIEEVMNLQLNSLLMRFVIERGSSPPSNWNYLSKCFELFSGHSCHCAAHGNNYRLIKMKDMSKIVLIVLGLKGGVTHLIADYRHLITHKLLCYQCYYI